MSHAFEGEERRLPWHSNTWESAERFYDDIESETSHARDRFKFPGAHLEDDHHSKEYWIIVILEEVGKLAQCINKLQIASDVTIRKQWSLEGYHRILTISSLFRRLAQKWMEVKP